jgi:tetratricopeptide (TPR) repeat protein
MKIGINNKPLTAIVCGFEHSGTTLISEILRQHPRLDSGFEGGFLLNNEAKDFLGFEPFYTNLKGGWGVSDEDLEYICSGEYWREVYHRLRERSSVIKNKTTWLFDKTPRYMQKLTHVLKQVPRVPCIVVYKDFRALMWSSFKRNGKQKGLTLEEWHEKIFPSSCNHILACARGWGQAIENGFGERILLVQYEKLCLNRVEESRKIFEFLELDFEESYLSFQEPRYEHVYGSEISTQYLTEYKENLPDYICQEILKVTEEYKDWLWSESESTNGERNMNLTNQQSQPSKLDKIIASHQQEIESNPRNFDAYINFGKALAEQGQLEQAILAYQEAIKINPNRPGGYGLLGNTQLRKGDLEGAIANYQKAIELDPKQPAGIYKNLEDALSKLEAIEPNLKQSAGVYKNLGDALKEKGITFSQKETRTDPSILRSEFKKHLTPEEIKAFGVDLPAGADHYRAYVGPPFNYDINSALQFQFLLDLGLREYHRFLEVGCGSLRLGRLLLMYLMPNRYFGLEPNVKILNTGIVENLGAPLSSNQLVKLKRPQFEYNSDFDFRFVGDSVDYIIAQSIASHTGVAETHRLLSNIGSIMHEGSIALVTYIRCGVEEKNNREDGWFYPDCVTYTDQFMGNLAKNLGLNAYKISWPLLNQRHDGLITSQTPLLLTKRPWQPTIAQRLAGHEAVKLA